MIGQRYPPFVTPAVRATELIDWRIAASRPQIRVLILGSSRGQLFPWIQMIRGKIGADLDLTVLDVNSSPRGKSRTQVIEDLIRQVQPTHLFVVVQRSGEPLEFHTELEVLFKVYSATTLLGRTWFFFEEGANDSRFIEDHADEMVALGEIRATVVGDFESCLASMREVADALVYEMVLGTGVRRRE